MATQSNKAMFQITFNHAKYGMSIDTATAKLDAYRQAAFIQNRLGQTYQMEFHADGAVTVKSAGLEGITFMDRSAAGTEMARAA